jgi:NADH-quinone oxidoreductase subunit L
MGGLLRKMPVTAITMLIGCLAIAGVGVPFVIGFSGYYSKDKILEQAYSFSQTNPQAWTAVFFVMAAGGAAITAFYMFRMWYLTFVGQPRDAQAYDHAHESPAIMCGPLVVLSVFAISVAWDTSLAGYGLIPLAFLLYEGARRGWFKRSGGGHAHDHAGHGHDGHGHESHGHEAHGHDAHGHDAHGHDAHGHGAGAHHDHPALPPISWQAVVTLLVVSVIGGTLLKGVLPESGLTLENLLKQAQPAGAQHAGTILEGQWTTARWPNEHASHATSIMVPVTLLATGTWLVGIGLATAMYALRWLNPEDVRRQFSSVYTFLVNKWWFDELYDWCFVRPTHAISSFIASFDRNWIDWLIDNTALCTRWFSSFWEKLADQTIVDGIANGLAAWTYAAGLSLRRVQTGRLRQYVMFIVIGAVAIFVLISFFWSTSLARG